MRLQLPKSARFIWITLLMALLAPWGLVANEGDFVIEHGPSVQIGNDNSVNIFWTTSRPSTGFVEYGESERLGSLTTQSSLGIVSATSKIHRVTLKNISVGSRYYYRVGSKEVISYNPYHTNYGKLAQSSLSQFVVAGPNKNELIFHVASDLHSHGQRWREMLTQISLSTSDLLILNGDMVDHFTDESLYLTQILDPAVETLNRSVPMLYARGNHETRGAAAARFVEFTNNGKDGLTYSFQQGGVYFVVLDSGEDKRDAHWEYSGLADFDSYRNEQAEWLKNEISKPAFKKAPFRIAVFHMPPSKYPFYHGPHQLQKKWVPILKEGGVDLLFCGHTHTPEIRRQGLLVDIPQVITGPHAFATVSATSQELKVLLRQTSGTVMEELVISRP